MLVLEAERPVAGYMGPTSPTSPTALGALGRSGPQLQFADAQLTDRLIDHMVRKTLPKVVADCLDRILVIEL